MSDDLLIKPKQENICLALEALKGCPGLLAEEQIVRDLNAYANVVATQAKDFKLSAAIREILENNESEPVAFQAAKDAFRFKYLADVFSDLAKQCIVSSQGMFFQAISGVEYKPQFALPDNEYGAYIFDQLQAMYEAMGVSKPGELKKVHQKIDSKIIQ